MNKDNKHLLDVAKILLYMVVYVVAVVKEKSSPKIWGEESANDLDRYFKNNIHD